MNRLVGTLFMGLAVSAFALAGCGDDSAEDDDGGSQTQVTTNTAAVGGIGQNTSAAVTSLTSGNGAAAANSLLSIGLSANAVIVPSSGGGSQTASAPELGSAAFSACETECTAEGESGSCTFAGCTDGTWTLEGSFSWGDGNLDADYSVSGAQAGSSYTFTVFADLTYTSTSIDGVLETTGELTTEAQGSTYSTSWDTSLEYDAVTWPETGGCPTSGSISGSAEITANGQGYSGDFDYTFDGTCT